MKFFLGIILTFTSQAFALPGTTSLCGYYVKDVTTLADGSIEFNVGDKNHSSLQFRPFVLSAKDPCKSQAMVSAIMTSLSSKLGTCIYVNEATKLDYSKTNKTPVSISGLKVFNQDGLEASTLEQETPNSAHH